MRLVLKRKGRVESENSLTKFIEFESISENIKVKLKVAGTDETIENFSNDVQIEAIGDIVELDLKNIQTRLNNFSHGAENNIVNAGDTQ